jgi:hypothetical protein
VSGHLVNIYHLFSILGKAFLNKNVSDSTWLWVSVLEGVKKEVYIHKAIISQVGPSDIDGTVFVSEIDEPVKRRHLHWP